MPVIVSIQVLWESPDCLEVRALVFCYQRRRFDSHGHQKTKKMKIPRQGRKLDMHCQKSNFVAKNKGFLFVANHRWRGKMNELTRARCMKPSEVVMLICQKENMNGSPISNGLRGQCHEKSAAFNHTSICSYWTLYSVHAFKLKQRELFLRN